MKSVFYERQHQGKGCSPGAKEWFQKLSNFPGFRFKQILIEFKRILAET
jgi:hypothetical protein